MIPKKIHYVWVGGQEKPAAVKRCMKSWQKHLKDYEIIEWNESNVDMHENKFIEQAYQQKKWAYVSDYIRAKAVYENGGIYLDTDVLVLDDLTQFLNNRAFVGFETPDYPFTATFGCEPHHPLAKKMLAYFDDRNFEFDVNDQNKAVNTKTVSDILINDYHCIPNNQEQLLPEDIHVYPTNILCVPSGQSSTIHVFTSTWMENMHWGFRGTISRFVRSRLRTKWQAGFYQKLSKHD